MHAPLTTTCPTAHVCAELRPTKKNRINTRNISIPAEQRAFIHARHELYISLISNQKYGATQLHCVKSVAPTIEVLNAGQAVQFVLPTADLYDPAAH